MALNIHTDLQFEKRLNWLSKRLKRTKTEVVKELVSEKYRLKKSGFQFASLKTDAPLASQTIQDELKQLDQDDDLD